MNSKTNRYNSTIIMREAKVIKICPGGFAVCDRCSVGECSPGTQKPWVASVELGQCGRWAPEHDVGSRIRALWKVKCLSLSCI